MSETINGSSLAYPVLSEAEMEVFEKLSKVEIKSYWLLGIQSVVKDFDEKKFREMICQMKCAAQDNPVGMRRILGEAFELVMSL